MTSGVNTRKLFHAFSLGFTAAAALVMSGCGRADSDGSNIDVDRLYTETCRLTRVYTDSMAKAKDSTTLMGMMKRFDERLTQLNFSVRPETDYHLSEGMNDTISTMIDSLRKTYDRRLYLYAHPHLEAMENDSIPTDSIQSGQRLGKPA